MYSAVWCRLTRISPRHLLHGCRKRRQKPMDQKSVKKGKTDGSAAASLETQSTAIVVANQPSHIGERPLSSSGPIAAE